jgi:hypothetical protein
VEQQQPKLLSPWQGLLQHPARGDHIVQLYQQSDALSDSVSEFAAAGLQAAEGVVLIVSAARWRGCCAQLKAREIDATAALRRGQLQRVDAHTLLSGLMKHGVTDPSAFREALGAILAMPDRAAVRVFNEMTDILWISGQRVAAVALEGHWSELAQRRRFSLLCACPMDSLDDHAYDGNLQAVCKTHTHLLPVRNCTAFDEAVTRAVNEVLEPQLARMLHSLAAAHRPPTEMPLGQATLLWMKEQMPRTAERVLSRLREHALAH